MALPYTERNVFGKINKIHSIAEYNPWTLFSYVLDKPLSLEAFNICFYLFVLCSVLSALGIFTRLSLSLTSIFYFLAIGTYLSFTKSPNTDYVSHSRNILVWIPLLLAISPGIKEYTLLNIQKWSGQFRSGLQIPNFGTQMVITTLALAYFAAGYCKVSKDLFWADGYTLQSYLYVKYLLLDIDLARTVAQSFWLCFFLGWATLAFELGFLLVVFFKKLRPLFAISGLLFHWGIYLTMDINFLTHMGLVYLIFMDIGFWNCKHTVSNKKFIPPFWYKYISTSFIALLLYATFYHVENWPLTDYRIYQEKVSYDWVRVFRIADITKKEKKWLPKKFFSVSPVQINKRYNYSGVPYGALSKQIKKLARPKYLKGRPLKFGVFERRIKYRNNELQIIDDLVHRFE